MRILAQTLSWLALLGTIVPSIAYYFEWIELGRCQWIMLLATVIWFVATPAWMGRERAAPPADVVNPV